MSQNVEVWNEGPFELHENFKGKEIRIPAGQCVVMDCYDAVEYKNQYKPIVTDGEKNHKPDGFKKLRIPNLYDVMNKAKEGVSELVCHATGVKAANEAELKQLTREHASMLEDDDVRNEVLKDERKASAEKDAIIAELQAQLAAATQAKPKRRGAPRKNEQRTGSSVSASTEGN